jgi:homoserine kinase type II
VAVYTQVSGRQIREYLKGYSIGTPEALVAIKKGVENSNYILETTNEKYILTLFEKRVNEKDIPFYLGLMNHLADHKVPCPRPIKKTDGSFVGTLAGKKSTIVSFLDGHQSQDISWMQCKSAGKMLAKIHHKASVFNETKPNNFGISSFRSLYSKVNEGLNKIQGRISKEVKAELFFIEENWSGFSNEDIPKGLIHGDYFPDNVFFQSDTVRGVFDFYFSCNDFYLYDLVIAINAWCWTGNEINVKKMAAMIKGYEFHRPLNNAEKNAFNIFMRAATMRFFLTRSIDWLNHQEDAINKLKDPLEYLKIMEFHQNKEGFDDYGLE